MVHKGFQEDSQIAPKASPVTPRKVYILPKETLALSVSRQAGLQAAPLPPTSYSLDDPGSWVPGFRSPWVTWILGFLDSWEH